MFNIIKCNNVKNILLISILVNCLESKKIIKSYKYLIKFSKSAPVNKLVFFDNSFKFTSLSSETFFDITWSMPNISN